MVQWVRSVLWRGSFCGRCRLWRRYCIAVYGRAFSLSLSLSLSLPPSRPHFFFSPPSLHPPHPFSLSLSLSHTHTHTHTHTLSLSLSLSLSHTHTHTQHCCLKICRLATSELSCSSSLTNLSSHFTVPAGGFKGNTKVTLVGAMTSSSDEDEKGFQPMEIKTSHDPRSFSKTDLSDEYSHIMKRQWPQIDRWMGLSAAMIMMGCNGLTYTYAVYSEYIKKQLHYSQEWTDDLGAAKDFGSVFGIVSGLCYFLFPPWVSVCIGAVMHFFGYIIILFTLTGRIKASFWFLCFSSAVATGGDNFVDTACIMTILESFKSHKGTAVGILKSQLGLSAAIFVTVYEAFLGAKVVNFLSLVTVVPSLVYCGLAFLIRPYSCNEEETDQSDVTQRFKLVSIIVVVLGSFLMGVMTLEEAFELEELTMRFFATSMILIMGAMLMVPLFYKPMERLRAAAAIILPVGVFSLDPVHHRKTVSKTDSDEELDMDEASILLNSVQDVPAEHGTQLLKGEEENHAEREIQEDVDSLYPSAWESLLGVDFWLVTLVVSSGAGSGLAIMNNFAQIGKAVRSDAVDAFVGIISIWSCFGRLVSGYGSDLMMNSGYSRPICLLISQTAMFICCLLLSTGSTLFLFIGSAIVGLAYGSYWTLAPTIIAEVFGLRQVATLYKFLGLGPTIASYLLSAKVLGYLYDKESLYQLGNDVEENTCYGKRCFEFGLLCLAFVCFVGVVACSWFAYRTKKIYSRIDHAQHTTLK